MHRLLQLLVSQPDLLVEHASAYAALASFDTQTATNAAKHKVLWFALLLCCASVSVILAGGSVMVWAAVPENTIRLPWVLLVVPLVPLTAALVCIRVLQPKAQVAAFANVRQQIAADIQMLREVSTS